MIIDFDANATYAPSEELQGVIAASLRRLGNPSSLHRGGQRAKASLEEVREIVRRLVGADPKDTVVFTSGATEGNNLVIRGFERASGSIVSSQIEHPCILGPLARLASLGCEVRLVKPEVSGEVSVDEVERMMDSDTTLLSIMGANNETGVCNDLASLVARARKRAPRAIVHSDISQLVGKGEVMTRDWGLDCVTISGHKFGALTGVGAVVIREGVELEPLILGGAQEGKLRGGTENVLGIISMGAAGERVLASLPDRVAKMRAARDRFESRVVSELSGCAINGAEMTRLPNTASIYIEGVRADDLVVALDLERMLISSGAACSSGKPEPSHVLRAMGQSDDRVRSTIRVSFRADQGPTVVDEGVEALKRAVTRMREVQSGGARE